MRRTAADRQRLTDLFCRHGDAVFAYANDRLGGEDARDLVSEVFAVAWRRLATIKEGQERPWLFGVARRLVLQHRRSRAGYAALRARLHSQAQADVTEYAPSASQRTDVMAALAELPEIDREVLLLRYWYDFNGRESAKVLGCTAATFAVRLHRAPRRFEDAYGTSAGGAESVSDRRSDRVHEGAGVKHYDAATGGLINRARPSARVMFTTTPQGQAMLARILELPPQPEGRSRKRRFGIAVAAAAMVLAAGGATAAIGGYHAPTGPPEAMPANDTAFVCATTGMHRMGETVARVGEAPVDACRRSWSRIFSVKAPAHLFACVQRIEAIPSPRSSASPSSETRWGKLVYVIDGEQFKNPCVDRSRCS
ncbi:RNA polymerase sigma factor [Micromonospora sp. NPDC020750]|uniref:RNA polymerase sigma factor n=1 Tax=Micromonospora sp. NPDC020750 TaxID=3364239 RepID=UPI00379F7E3B